MRDIYMRNDIPKNIHFWQKLGQGLSICSPSCDCETEKQTRSVISEEISPASDSLHHQGYFQFSPFVDMKVLNDLYRTLLVFEQHNIPPVYIYIYDQAWEIFGGLRPFISQILGDDCTILPNLWAWHVKPEAGARGWPIHKDCQAETSFRIDKDSYIFMSLSIWIPLMDVTIGNGCMHVLPRDLTVKYENASSEYERDVIVQKATPLPIQAGAAIGWAQDIYHFSDAMTLDSNKPRLSLSLEFQNMSFEVLSNDVIDNINDYNLHQRLSLIESQFQKYKHII